jgi:hypothetical protein
MITGKHRHADRINGWPVCAVQGRQGNGQLLQLPERAWRFGQNLLSRCGKRGVLG